MTDASFACALCGTEAGSIRLLGRDVRREAFTSVPTQQLSVEAAERLHDALDAVDAGAVFAVDAELAPFYCPECAATYCGEHWNRIDIFDDDPPSWHDSIRGRCPLGHERMLED